jgi:hypothetical protein
MGRPLKKKMFGANNNMNIKVQFNTGSTSTQGFIVNQVGSRRFTCSTAAPNGSAVKAICKLANTATPAPGEMSITVKLDGGYVARVQKISSRMLTIYSNTVTNTVRYPWNFSTSTTDTFVQVEEAGNTTTSMSTATGASYLV